jgi:hypothetical protein
LFACARAMNTFCPPRSRSIRGDPSGCLDRMI